jgi:peroxiredoxin
MKSVRHVLKSIGVSLFALCAVATAPQMALSEGIIGNQAPQFTAKDSTGKEISLNSFKGKVVVLEWFNPNCPFVKKFYKNGDMQRFQQDLGAKGVVWLTISSSAPGKSGHLTAEQAEVTRVDLGMKSSALVLDESGTIGKAYGARTTPHTFVIAADGKLAYAGAIDSESSTDADDIPKAKNYVIDAATNLLANKPVEVSSTEPYGCAVKY